MAERGVIVFMRTQFELSIMSWTDLRTHYNTCAKSKALTEATGGKLTEEEQAYFDYLFYLVQVHCENPNNRKPLSEVLKHYKQ
jgi:hypothetical protein